MRIKEKPRFKEKLKNNKISPKLYNSNDFQCYLNLSSFVFYVCGPWKADRYYKWARIFISPPVDDSVVVHPVIVTIVTKSFPMVDVAAIVVVTTAVFVSSVNFVTFDSELVAFSISADLAFESVVIVSWLPLLLFAFKNSSSISWMVVLDLDSFVSMIELVVLLVLLSLLRGWLVLPTLLLLPPIIAGIRKRLFRVRL